MTEIWRDIFGFEGVYQVSIVGQIKSLARTSPDGRSLRERVLKPSKGPNGYLFVHLSRNSKRTARYIHHLVLEAFVGALPKGMECRHLDGVRTNNHKKNLKWGTRSENERDKIRHGTDNRGEKHVNSKLTDEQVRTILTIPGTQQSIADYFGITNQHVSKIKSGECWKHITR